MKFIDYVQGYRHSCRLRCRSERCVAPAQVIAIDEDYPTQPPPVIDPGLAVGLRKEGFETRHLRLHRPEKIAYTVAPFSKQQISRQHSNQWIL